MSTTTTIRKPGRRATTVGIQAGIIAALFAVIIALTVGDSAQASTGKTSDAGATGDGMWVCAPADEAIYADIALDASVKGDVKADGSESVKGATDESGAADVSDDATDDATDDTTTGHHGERWLKVGTFVTVHDLSVWIDKYHHDVTATVDAKVDAKVKSNKGHTTTVDGSADADAAVTSHDGYGLIDVDALVGLFLGVGTDH